MHSESFQSFYKFRYSFEENDVLEYFGTFLKSYAEITKADRLLRINIDRQITSNIGRRITIDVDRRQTIRENQHLRKSQVLPKTPSYCTISHWPHVRLFIKVLYHFGVRPS